MAFEWRPEEVKERAMGKAGGRALYVEERACAKALRYESSWHIQGTEGGPVWLELRTKWVREGDKGVRGRAG